MIDQTHVMAWLLYQYILFIYFMQMGRVTNQGLVKFRDIKLSGNFKRLSSGRCCNYCQCRVKLKICLKPYETDVCLIEVYSKQYLTTTTKTMDLKFQAYYSHPLKLNIQGITEDTTGSDNVVFEIADENKLTFVNSSKWPVVYERSDVRLSFYFKLECRKNYYGPNCGKICEPRNDELGHYTCNYLGERICHPGWSEPETYCVKRKCVNKCLHGRCDASQGKCICDQGWMGEACEIDKNSCLIIGCLNNGVCLRNGSCKCVMGYRGIQCEMFPTTSRVKSIKTSLTVLPSFSITTTLKTSLTNVKYTPSSPISQSIETPSLKSSQSDARSSVEYLTKYGSVEMHSSSTFYTEGVDVSNLISKTSWVTITERSLPVVSNSAVPTSVTIKHNNREMKVTVLALLSVVSFIFLAACFLVLFLIWKRKKCISNKRQTTPVQNLIEYQDSMKSIPSGTSISTVQSVLTPIINKCSDTDSGTCVEPPELDLVSVAEYHQEFPGHTNTVDFEKYTLQAVDRMCWEVIQGSTSRKYERKKERLKSKRNSIDVTTKTLKPIRKLYNNSGYCSSGYNSSGNSPPPKSATSSRSQSSLGFSSENSFTSVLHLLHNINEQVTSFITNDNNNNDDETSTKVTEISTTTSSSDGGDFTHNKQTFDATNFEGLPNFICYNEDDEMTL